MSGLDLTPLEGKTGLVSEHSVTSDGETTRMRSGRDLKEINDLLTNNTIACDTTKRTNVMRNIFGFRAVPQNYRST